MPRPPSSPPSPRPRAAVALAGGLLTAVALCACGPVTVPATAAAAKRPDGPAATSARAEPRRARAPAQEREPVDALRTYLDGFHFYNGRPDAQAETHQWCAPLDADVSQCVLFDGSGPNARLVGVEYVVSERVYMQLPAEEKRLWHSHAYDVRSGTLVAPGLSDADERELMGRYVHTYGKTWTTWNVDSGPRVPTGIPELMMSFTGDGQVDRRLVAMRDQRLGVSTAANERVRADIPEPRIDSEADAWRRGAAPRLALEPFDAVPARTRVAEAPAP